LQYKGTQAAGKRFWNIETLIRIKKVNTYKNIEKRRVTCVYNGAHTNKWERTLSKSRKLITLIKIKLRNEG
jgi:hypothetical protein